MVDLVFITLVVAMMIAITEYLRRLFAETHPEFLPFLKFVRWVCVIGGGLFLLGTLLTVVADLVGA
jgi:hypothetical protein